MEHGKIRNIEIIEYNKKMLSSIQQLFGLQQNLPITFNLQEKLTGREVKFEVIPSTSYIEYKICTDLVEFSTPSCTWDCLNDVEYTFRSIGLI